MVRLIDANKLLDRFSMDDRDQFHVIQIGDVIDAIEGTPTVDPVKHAHWIFYKDMGNKYIRCSNCGAESGYDDEINRLWGDYCKYCGAKMDEVAE